MPGVRFYAVLTRHRSQGGWVSAVVPDDHAPAIAGPLGRIPVVAVVDERSWRTSVWLDHVGRWLLVVPRSIRREKDDGDVVSVAIAIDRTRLQLFPEV
ncbi:DUF1905 domain-containing protein [Pseudonocardia sp. TRM90224]|uniref:DUF1905 domain-containing protein n=1 Tax=Pseudonocardia sp. TRM90224 TaxID=2812678 RepID=UPI001E4F2934|nr:DUF1905 domain-containing protein [Pseudonocardia sp. TRM90224]